MTMIALKKRPATVEEPRQPEAAPAPLPAIALGVLVGELDGRFRARIAGAERLVDADASVDPELLREAVRTGARVVLEPGADGAAAPVIVGVLATARALTIDRTGAVEADVRRFVLRAREEALLAATGAFVRAKRQEIE